MMITTTDRLIAKRRAEIARNMPPDRGGLEKRGMFGPAPKFQDRYLAAKRNDVALIQWCKEELNPVLESYLIKKGWTLEKTLKEIDKLITKPKKVANRGHQSPPPEVLLQIVKKMLQNNNVTWKTKVAEYLSAESAKGTEGNATKKG